MAKGKSNDVLSSSFRDPSGFVFSKQGVFYRQINRYFKEEFDAFISTGLYDDLVKQGLIIPHKEVPLSNAQTPEAYKIIQPETIPTISYPYEWSFSQYKDAALATIRIQKIALAHDMVLKDASAYNIQFIEGKPVFIDTLSFEKYVEGEPWIAYRQFCQHFLGPLALASRKDMRLTQLMQVYIDGIPLDLTSKLLPTFTKIHPHLATHIHMHARTQTKYADNKVSLKQRKAKMSKLGLTALIDNLEGAIKGMQQQKQDTEWAEYYTFTNYTDKSFRKKRELVEEFVELLKPTSVWDLGGNTGEFSRVASDKGIHTVSWDIDPNAVEFNYQTVKKNAEKSLLPLILDLTNPSPGLGWAHEERMSLAERGPVDMVFALAVIHHLRITGNIPLTHIASFFSRLGKHLVIEFVPKDDSQTQILLKNREDIFSDYEISKFEKVFKEHFSIIKKVKIEGTKRTLYLMKRK